MLGELKKQFTSLNVLIFLLIIAVGLYLFQIMWQILALFSDVLIILVFAWIISFILEPLVHSLNKVTRIPKVISALLVYTTVFGLFALTVILFIPAVTSQVETFAKILPKYLASYPPLINRFSTIAVNSLDNSLALVPPVAQFLFSFFIVLIISFYFVIDKEHILEGFFAFIPKKLHTQAKFMQHLVDSVFGSFLRVQLLFGLIAGISTWIALRAFSLDFAASTALVAGLLTVIPLLGPVLGIIPPIAIAFLADPFKGLFVTLALLLMQQILFNVVGPKLLGNALKMHPIIIIISFFIGNKLAGGVGAILAVPILGILFVIVQRLSHHYLNQSKSS